MRQEDGKIVFIHKGEKQTPTDLGRRLMAAFPQARIVSFYGLVEAGAAQCMKVFDPARPDSIGRPLPGRVARVLGRAR